MNDSQTNDALLFKKQTVSYFIATVSYNAKIFHCLQKKFKQNNDVNIDLSQVKHCHV